MTCLTNFAKGSKITFLWDLNNVEEGKKDCGYILHPWYEHHLLMNFGSNRHYPLSDHSKSLLLKNASAS